MEYLNIIHRSFAGWVGPGVAAALLLAATVALAQSKQETVFWDSVKSCADPEDVRLYLQEYPNGHYRTQAKACLAGRASGVVTWDRTFGGSKDDVANSILATSDGGFVVAGRTESKGAGGYDAWVIKLDGGGRKVWDRIFGGRFYDWASSITSTRDGGTVVAGSTTSKDAGNADVWVIKLDRQGLKVWERTFGGRDGDWASSITSTPDGGTMVAGQTSSKGVGQGDAWVIKLDRNGRKVWDRSFRESGNDSANSIASTPDGGTVVAGYTQSKSTDGQESWVIKLDRKGRKIWDRIFGWWEYDAANSIISTPNGGTVVAGTSQGDVWVIKLDRKGRKVWERTFGGSAGDGAASITATPDGGTVVAGWTASKGAGGSDAWVIKLDRKGRKVWDRTFGGRDSDWANSILATSDGGFVVAGGTESKGAGKGDAWVIKLDANGRLK